MVAHSTHQKFPVDFIKETSDVKVQHPVVTPASLPSHSQCIMGRPPGAIPIGVFMEHRLQYWLQISLYYRLGDAIRDSRNSERPRTSLSLRYVNPAYCRREITAGRHPVPDPIKIVTQ